MSATERNITNVFAAFTWDDVSDLDTEALIALKRATSDAAEDPLHEAGDRLKAARKKAQLSLRKLAESLGDDTHFTTIAKLETGRMKLTEEWAVRLGPLLGLHPIDLLAEPGTPGAARKVPVFDATSITIHDNVIKYPQPSEHIISSSGGPSSFAILAKMMLGVPNTHVYVQIDPDLQNVKVGGSYFMFLDDHLVLASFEDDPARFSPWITAEADDEMPEVQIGTKPFRIIGRAFELVAKL